MPVLFITQVVGLALGLSPETLGLKRHFIDTRPLLADMSVRATQRVADEKKAAEEKAAKAAARAAKEAEAKADKAKAAGGGAAPADAAPDGGGDS